MKKVVIIASVLAASLPVFAQTTPLYLAGDFQPTVWTAGDPNYIMSDLGGGIWSETLTGLTPSSFHQFKVTEADWNWSAPLNGGDGNSWFYADANGNATITYDLNTENDGWFNTVGRIGVNNDPGTWTAVGDWQGWNNANAATAMTSMGGGIYELSYTIATPGTYAYKAVDTGSWNAIGTSRSVNAGTLAFTTSGANEQVNFFVNALAGTIQVTAVPEPATMALFGMGGLLMVQYIIRRKR